MTKDLEEALSNVQMTYQDLVQISDDILTTYTSDIDELIRQANVKIEIMTVEDVRQLMLKLSLKSYSLCEVKEKSALKLACAEALKDEVYAKSYNEATGTVKERESTASSSIRFEVMSEAVFNEVYSMLKSKVDETHRVVDALKSVLMSRMQEVKMTMMSRDNDFGE